MMATKRREELAGSAGISTDYLTRLEQGPSTAPSAQMATTGCTWRQLPPVFGPSGLTAHRRFTEWGATRVCSTRVWAKPHRLVLAGPGSRGDVDWSRCTAEAGCRAAMPGGPLHHGPSGFCYRRRPLPVSSAWM